MSAGAPAEGLAALALTPLQTTALGRAVATLREFYDPPAIFLFGSAARGAATDNSDMDLLVRIARSDLPRQSRAHAFHEVFAQTRPRFDVAMFTDAEVAHHLANPRSFLCSVLVSAVPLFLQNPATEPLLLVSHLARRSA